MKNGSKLHRYLGKLALVIGVLSLLMFVNPGFGETGLIIYVLVVYLLWDMTYSFQDVAIWGTLSLISPHSSERAKGSQWVSIGARLGSAIVGIIPAIMGITNSTGFSEKNLFFLCGLVFGFGGEALSMLVLKTKERIVHPNEEKKESFVKQLLDVRKNKILVALIAAQILGSFSLTLPTIYFFKYCVSYTIGNTVISGETVQYFYGLCVGLPGVLSMFAATWIMNKLGGHKKALILTQLFQIVIRAICYFVGYSTLPRLIIVALLNVAASIPSGIISIVNRSFLCDSIDYMEWKTGKRTEGVVSSLQNFVSKLGSALQTFINGAILEALHFNNKLDGITGQPPEFYKWQWPIFIIGPAIGAALYVLPLLLLKYTPAEREKVEMALREKRAAEMVASKQE